MRISDWSSDVCSSDHSANRNRLQSRDGGHRARPADLDVDANEASGSSFGGKLMCDCPTRSSRYVSEVFLIGDRRHLVNNSVNVALKRRPQELDLSALGDTYFDRFYFLVKLVCN